MWCGPMRHPLRRMRKRIRSRDASKENRPQSVKPRSGDNHSLGREPQEPNAKKGGALKGDRIRLRREPQASASDRVSPLRGSRLIADHIPGAHAPGYVYAAASRLVRPRFSKVVIGSISAILITFFGRQGPCLVNHEGCHPQERGDDMDPHPNRPPSGIDRHLEKVSGRRHG